MSKYSYLTAGTKIYLDDFSLVNVEDLKFGDKVLSLKIIDNKNNNPVDFYYNYINNNDIKFDQLLGNKTEFLNKISKISKVQLSSSNIFRVEKIHKESSFYLLNNIIVSKNQNILITKAKGLSLLKDEASSEMSIVNVDYLYKNKERISDNLKVYGMLSLNYNEDTDNSLLVMNDINIEKYNKKQNIQCISFLTLENYLYFTENFVFAGGIA